MLHLAKVTGPMPVTFRTGGYSSSPDVLQIVDQPTPAKFSIVYILPDVLAHYSTTSNSDSFRRPSSEDGSHPYHTHAPAPIPLAKLPDRGTRLRAILLPISSADAEHGRRIIAIHPNLMQHSKRTREALYVSKSFARSRVIHTGTTVNR